MKRFLVFAPMVLMVLIMAFTSGLADSATADQYNGSFTAALSASSGPTTNTVTITASLDQYAGSYIPPTVYWDGNEIFSLTYWWPTWVDNNPSDGCCSGSATANIHLPLSAQQGAHTIRVETSNTLNHTVYTQDLTFTVTSPDLAVTSASAPDVITKGVQPSITWTVANNGNGNATSSYGCADSNGSYPSCWKDDVYLSTDTQLDPSDIGIAGQTNNSALAPGGTYSVTLSPTKINAPSGQYYLLIKTDAQNSVTESDETNNIYVGPHVTVEGKDPDLIVTSAVVPDVIEQASTVNVIFTILNQGEGGAFPTWADGVYLSADDRLDGGDNRLNYRQL
ncbi:MAG: CARDB domain-containing protein, partial [Actinomycetota bacterium]